MRRATVLLGIAAVGCALLAACGSEDEEARREPVESPKLARAAPEPPPEPEPEPEPEPAVEEPEGACGEGRYERMRTQRLAHAAVARHPLRAFRSPGGELLARFEKRNVNNVSTVFGVLGRVLDRDCEVRWYRVQLPMKPNGVVGYVRAGDVELHPIDTRILVELSARRVTFFRDGRKVLEAPAAVGTARTPTPTGYFYVNQRLRPRDPTGPFGPGAVGISAFTEVLTGWTQGGPIALHGTNRPHLIGQAVSNGCIRLHNDVLERIYAQAPLGTPVVVRP